MKRPLQIKQERLGEIFVLVEVLLFSIFPILINQGTKTIPPLFLAGITTLIASPLFLIQLIASKKLKELFHTKTLLYTLIVALCIQILPSIFIFKGTQLTSSINTAILLQIEIVFTLPVCALLTNEKITKSRLLTSSLVLLGSIFVLYKDGFKINFGDLLIIIGTMIYPLGNIYAKKAFKICSASTILFVRTFLGGLTLLSLSYLFENTLNQGYNLIAKNFVLIFTTGIIVTWLSKIFWYEGLKRLDITKALILTKSYPALSLLWAIVFVGEKANLFQILGLLIIMSGIYLSIFKVKKLSPAEQNPA